MKCPVCSNEDFSEKTILKQRLIDEWELAPYEVDYINKQQGYHCIKCLCNLRSLGLADSIMKYYKFKGQFQQFCYSKFGKKLNVLEINEAGSLYKILRQFKNYVFAKYPEIDIQKMPYENNTFDLIIHSDTLEHVEDSSLALKECFRVLKEGGVLFYTIPIVYSRLTRRRDKLPESFHGTQDETQGIDFKVVTEYGADFWVEIIKAGFTEVSISTIDGFSTLPICAKKGELQNYKKRKVLTYKYYFRRGGIKIKKLFKIIKYGIYWRKIYS